METAEMVEVLAARAKEAAAALAEVPAADKNEALYAMADLLESNIGRILEENTKDMEAAREGGLRESMLDRLLLTGSRVRDMAVGLRQVAALPDPVGEIVSGRETARGLSIAKVRVPFGVIAIIYEARPNVTADAAGLCVKTGNAVILRGGSEELRSNRIIAEILAVAALKAKLPQHSIQFVNTADRKAVDEIICMRGGIDLVIPRGGAGLIKKVVENSRVPVIETGAGICHTFVDASADLSMASNIAFNAKVSRPSVCNAMETLLVHEEIAGSFLPAMLDRLDRAGVEIFGDRKTCALWPKAQAATEEDWATEYGDLRLSVKVVAGLEAALGHIAQYGSKHSEAIVTRDLSSARRFQKRVDAAAVYVNASTRFTDGFEFGFGAEIGISTQKLHARGPMGLAELTSFKYIIDGDGQTR
jgi:glutamate-5-semialdehyde dehydrogenase